MYIKCKINIYFTKFAEISYFNTPVTMTALSCPKTSPAVYKPRRPEKTVLFENDIDPPHWEDPNYIIYD